MAGFIFLVLIFNFVLIEAYTYPVYYPVYYPQNCPPEKQCPPEKHCPQIKELLGGSAVPYPFFHEFSRELIHDPEFDVQISEFKFKNTCSERIQPNGKAFCEKYGFCPPIECSLHCVNEIERISKQKGAKIYNESQSQIGVERRNTTFYKFAFFITLGINGFCFLLIGIYACYNCMSKKPLI